MTMSYDPSVIEKKWQERWKEKDIFRAEVDPSREKFFITVAWPYPSGSMHVGHARTYLFPDIIARYKRKKGYNVLFPMGWHLTGTPIVGSVERLEENDKDFLKMAKEVFLMSDEDINGIKTPEDYAMYFIEKSELGYKKGLNGLGMSIDWSKEFTSVTPAYSREVEWQYRKFREKNLVTTGKHPVKFCPRDNNPVTDHDLLEGEGVDIQEFFVIEYELDYKGRKISLPAATLRTETVFGITNLWIKEGGNYVIAEVDGKDWLLSKKASSNLGYQRNTKVKEEIKSEEIAGKMVKNPVTKELVPIIEADFVDVDAATGVVGSVPAHAPYDYVALNGRIEPKQVMEVEGYSDCPARDVVERMNIKSQDESKKLDEATRKLYRDEHRKGRMMVEYKDFKGKDSDWAKKEIEKELVEMGKGSVIYEFSKKPVRCRCGSYCVVKIVSDQWFIQYSDENWKNVVKDYLKEMDLVPKGTRNYFLNVVDWLNDWPFTRIVGMGTRVPWDKRWIIESLSDSTIYMSYYTLADILNDFEGVDDEFFDYIFSISHSNKWAGNDIAEKAKTRIEYWYPLDYRVSASELIPNHLTFMVFHHTALFPRKFWPRGIISLGLVILEGNRMSSSRGIVYPVAQSLKDFGADVTRLYLMYSVEPWQDFNWKSVEAQATSRQLQHFYDVAMEIIQTDSGEKNEHIDGWLLSTLQKNIKRYEKELKNFKTRSALQIAFYEMMNDYRWYIRRKGRNGEALKEFLERWINLLSPFVPHVCEEIWEKMGHKTFLSLETFPQAREENKKCEKREEYIKNVFEDMKAILQVLPISPKKIIIYCIPEERDLIDEDFFAREFNCEVEVQVLGKVKYDPKNRSKNAKPGKPAIYVE